MQGRVAIPRRPAPAVCGPPARPPAAAGRPSRAPARCTGACTRAELTTAAMLRSNGLRRSGRAMHRAMRPLVSATLPASAVHGDEGKAIPASHPTSPPHCSCTDACNSHRPLVRPQELPSHRLLTASACSRPSTQLRSGIAHVRLEVAQPAAVAATRSMALRLAPQALSRPAVRWKECRGGAGSGEWRGSPAGRAPCGPRALPPPPPGAAAAYYTRLRVPLASLPPLLRQP